MDQRIGFIGAGQMATALARGVVQAQVVTAEQISAHDPVLAAKQRFLDAVPGAAWADDNARLVAGADVVVLAIKPQQFREVAAELRGRLEGKLVVSVIAGLRLDDLSKGLNTARVIRVMPNTPCLVGYGAAGYARGPAATEEHAHIVNRMLEAVGIAFALPETQLDAVTGLSGSGPAFVALFIEALTDGGVRMGLPRATALKLAAQTVRGTAELVLVSDQPPAAIKDQVASPGGTTIAGIQALEERAFRGAVMAAVAAATERARQLGDLK